MIDNMLEREKERIDLEIRRAAPEMADDGTVTKTKEQVVAGLKQEKRTAEATMEDAKNKDAFDENTDFLFLPALKEWRLDGMIRSVDIDGSPRLMTQDGRPTLANTSDKSVSALVNVIGAAARVVEGIGYDKKSMYAPQNQKLSHRANVFDQLVLVLVKQEKKGKRHYKIVRSTRSYKTVTTCCRRAMARWATVSSCATGSARRASPLMVSTGPTRTSSAIGARRCVEEPSKTDRACGIIFTGGLCCASRMLVCAGRALRRVEL